MPHKVKVSGSRSLKKGSKKNSKKNSKSNSLKHKQESKHAGIDFTSILDDMNGNSSVANMMGPQQMQMDPSMMMQQQGMQQQQMQMDPNMLMQQGMMNPNMPMDQSTMQMMMGKQYESNNQEVDPLNIQYIVPQNKNLNINNYGVSYEQLLKGSQHNGLADKFNSQGASNNEQ